MSEVKAIVLKNVREEVKTMEMVFSRPAYIALAAVTAILFSAFYYKLSFYFSPLSYVLSPAMAGKYFLDQKSFWTLSLGLSFILSGMLGVNTAMLIYRFRSLGAKPRQTGGTFLSGILGAVASGCPACGAPILALFGFSTGLALFPMQGLELKLISIILLRLSIRSLSKSIVRACRIK